MKTFFVSSTFRDMHFERDAIHKKVSPMVNELSRQYGQAVEFCDLRWGISTDDLDSQEGAKRVLSVCLDEIDRCKPYMIVILGERYGWIPEGQLLADAMVHRQIQQLDCLNTSVTALEIEYGALSAADRTAHTLFYFREMSGEVPEDYRAENSHYFEQLGKLKERIINLTGGKVRFYRTAWNEEQKTLEGMDAFAEMVSNDIRGLLAEEWERTANLSVFDRDALTHWEYARQKSQIFQAREHTIAKLKSILQNGTSMISVYGDSGNGKSTVMSRLAVELSQEADVYVVPIFCGLTANAHDMGDIIKCMIYHLQRLLGLKGDAEISVYDNQELFQRLFKLIGVFMPSGKRAVFVIDAIDQLLADATDQMQFVAKNLRGPVQIVVSHIKAIQWNADCHQEQVGVLSKEEIPLVVRGILRTKQISDAVLQFILSKSSAGNPLYLNLLIRRIEMMGKAEYDTIQTLGGDGAAISTYQVLMVAYAPDDTEALCTEIIDVAAQNIGADFINYAMDYLAVSANGLRPSDLQSLLCAKGIAWNQLTFSMFLQYLHDFFSILEDGRIAFSHKSIQKGVLARVQDKVALRQDLFMHLDSLNPRDPLRMQDILVYAAKTDNKRYIIKYINDHFNDPIIITNTAKAIARMMKVDYNLWWAQLIENAMDYDVVTHTVINHNFLGDFINIYLVGEFTSEHHGVDLHLRRANYLLAKKLLEVYPTEDMAFSFFQCISKYANLYLENVTEENVWRAKALLDEALQIWSRLSRNVGTEHVVIMCNVADVYAHIGHGFMKLVKINGNKDHCKAAEEAYLTGLQLVKTGVAEANPEALFAYASICIHLGICYKYFPGKDPGARVDYWLKAVSILENIKYEGAEIRIAEVLSSAYGELGMYYSSETTQEDAVKAKMYLQKNITYYQENVHRLDEQSLYSFQMNYMISLNQLALVLTNHDRDYQKAVEYTRNSMALAKRLYPESQPIHILSPLSNALRIFVFASVKLGQEYYLEAAAQSREMLKLLGHGVRRQPILDNLEVYAKGLVEFAIGPLSETEEKIQTLQTAADVYRKMYELNKNDCYLREIDKCNREIVTLQSKPADAKDVTLALDYFKKGDYQNAYRLYSRLAEAGNAVAQTNLGVMYIQGLYVEKDHSKALHWLQLAADQGMEMAKEYVKRLKAESVQKSGEALFQQALALYQAGNLAAALRSFLILAQKGHMIAQYIVGNMYDFGESVPKNDAVAFSWYLKSAEQGYADAQYNVGVLYADGRGVQKNVQQAVEWFQKAAEQGNQDARHELISLAQELADQYHEEAFAAYDANDIEKAITMFEASGKYGNTNAYLNLGIMFLKGEVVKEDLEKARFYMKKAMDMGNMQAKELYDRFL